MPRRKPSVPRLARAILDWTLPESERDFVLDDLDLRYQRLCSEQSPRAARRWYRRQVIGALRVRGAWPTPAPAARAERPTLADRLGRASAAVRLAIRSLARRPGLATMAVLALALGIGATTTAFSVVWGTVLRGLPFEDADHLVHFERENLSEDQLSLPVTPHDYVAWRDNQTSFEGLGAFVEAVAQIPMDAGPPARYGGVFISANSFGLLRAEPALGRVFNAEEDRPGGPAVAVIAHGLWQQDFGGDPSIVGRVLVLNGRPTTVVGVMPEGFGFPVAEQVWLPLSLNLADVERGQGRLDVFGRLAEGVDLERARVEMEAIAARLAREYPETNDGILPSLQTFQHEYVGPDFSRTVYRMLAGAVLVLLVACANVANLLLARARSRTRELAVRTALGAGRSHLLGVLFAEAAVLTGAGAALGVGLAHIGVAWFVKSGAQAGVFALPHGTAALFWWDVRVDAVALLFVLGISFATALAAGLLPGWYGASTDPGTTLRSPSTGRGGGDLSRWSRGLVVGEVALTTGLLVVAGLMLRSVMAATSAAEPVPTDGIMTARVSLPLENLGVSESRYAEHDQRLAFARELDRTLSQNAGVLAASIVTQLPTERPGTTTFSLPGDEVGRDVLPSTWVSTVSSSFFSVFDVQAVAGRAFGPEDAAGTEPVAVINQSFEARYFAAGSALGQRIRLGLTESDEPWVTIVGVIPDLWTNARELEQHTVYVPLAQSGTPDPTTRLGRWGLRFLTVAVRAETNVAETVRQIRGAVFATDPDIPVYRVRSMNQVAEQTTGRYRVWSRFYAAFAVVALFLAAVGLYGVMAFGVSQRTGEIGIRRALGARRRTVVLGVLESGLRQISAGAAIGILIALWLARGMDRILFQVEAADPLVFGIVLVLITSVGLAASWIPARRAASISPTEALRAD